MVKGYAVRVALGAAAGLGLGTLGAVVLPPLLVPGEQALGSQVAPLLDAEPATLPAPEAAAQAPANETPAPGNAEQAPAGEAPEPAPGPRFDTVRIEPDGSGLVAGRGEPGTLVAVLAGDALVGEATADADGRFVAFLTLPASSEPLTLSLRDAAGALSEETVLLGPTVPETALASAGPELAPQAAPLAGPALADAGPAPTDDAAPGPDAGPALAVAAEPPDPEAEPVPDAGPALAALGEPSAVDPGGADATGLTADAGPALAAPATPAPTEVGPADATLLALADPATGGPASEVPPAPQEPAGPAAADASVPAVSPVAAEPPIPQRGDETAPDLLALADPAPPEPSVGPSDDPAAEPSDANPDPLRDAQPATPEEPAAASGPTPGAASDGDPAITAEAPPSDVAVAEAAVAAPLTDEPPAAAGDPPAEAPPPERRVAEAPFPPDATGVQAPAAGSPAPDTLAPDTLAAGPGAAAPGTPALLAEAAPPSDAGLPAAAGPDEVPVHAAAPEVDGAPPAALGPNPDAGAPAAPSLQASATPSSEAGLPGTAGPDTVPVPASAPDVAEAAPGLPPAAEAQPPGQAAVLLSDAQGVRVLQPALPPGAAPEVLTTVALDAISYDGAGEVLLQGRGTPGDAVRLYLDNWPLAAAPIGPDGTWTASLAEADPGVYTLRVDQVAADGTVVSRTESPFQRERRTDIEAALAEAQRAGNGHALRIVQPGNTLWAIARDRYGEPLMYVRVFEANRDRIRNPDLIYPGQVFVLPELGSTGGG